MAPIPIHPAEHLAEELAALRMSAAELARQLKVPTNRITEILNASAPSPPLNTNRNNIRRDSSLRSE